MVYIGSLGEHELTPSLKKSHAVCCSEFVIFLLYSMNNEILTTVTSNLLFPQAARIKRVVFLLKGFHVCQ